MGSAPLATGEVTAGIFVATPPHEEFDQFVGGTSIIGGGAIATGTFDSLTAEGTRPGGDWTTVTLGGDDRGRPSGHRLHAGG